MTTLYRIDSPDGAGAVGTVLDRAQDKSLAAIAALQASPLAPARLLTGVTIGTAATNVPHGLRRRLVGWTVVRLAVNTTIWEISPQPDTARWIALQAGTATTVDLLVF